MEFLNKFDKQRVQKITLMIIAALTLLALILLLVIVISSVEGAPDPDIPTIVGKDNIEFENMAVDSSQLTKGTLVLINDSHKYEIPEDLDLVLISTYRDTNSPDTIPYSIYEKYHMKLEATATEYAHAMLTDMGKITKNDDIMIMSSFRSYDDQSSVSKSIAAGYSDHHSGMLITLRASKGALADVHVTWLNENAYKYGFVVRYPADKTEITGVSDYTNAYRYVGIPHAKYMTENNLCLEEYVEYLKNNTTNKKPLSVTCDDGNTYNIYYCAVDGSANEIKVPVKTANPDGSMNNDYTISGTNDGGVVITVNVK